MTRIETELLAALIKIQYFSGITEKLAKHIRDKIDICELTIEKPKSSPSVFSLQNAGPSRWDDIIHALQNDYTFTVKQRLTSNLMFVKCFGTNQEQYS